MSDTGGGHRAAALAINEAIHHLYPDKYDTIIEDIWKEHTPWPMNKIPDVYPWMTGAGMPVWKLIWLMSTTVPSHKLLLSGVSPLVKRRLAGYYREVQPDLIVSVHPLMNHLGVKIRNQAGLTNVPFATTVTDMVTIHPAWIYPGVDFCTVPTEPARDLALNWGMPASKIVVTGQPVGLKFAHQAKDKAALKAELGLFPDRRTVLVVGGGEGFGRVFDIARAIAAQAPHGQMMVVSGRNAALKEKLEAVKWEIPVRIFGFVTNMPELMGAADILVTKAGPGTISEAFIAGLPVILSGYIPGQEAGNVAYVQEHQAGLLCEDPARIGYLVQQWMDPNNAILQQMAGNAAALARPDAAMKIATGICNLI